MRTCEDQRSLSNAYMILVFFSVALSIIFKTDPLIPALFFALQIKEMVIGMEMAEGKYG